MRPSTGHTLPACGAGPVFGTLAGVADRLSLYSFTPPRDLAIDQVAINVTTLLAASNAKVVVYSALPSGLPGDRIVETGNLDCATTGFKAANVSLNLLAGQPYWFGVRTSGTQTLSALSSQVVPDIPAPTFAITARKTFIRTVPFASAAPASWGAFAAGEVNTALPYAVWLRSL
jgi:hypothetical protein